MEKGCFLKAILPRISINRAGAVLFFAAIACLITSVRSEWEHGEIGSIVYSVFTPEGYSTSNTYPVIMLLHGVGEIGNTHSNETEQDAQILASPETQETYPCIIYAPQCPSDDRWVKFENDNWNTCIYSADDISETAALRDALDGLNDSICVRYSVDLDKIYIAGGSMGGYGVWDLLCRHPDNKFAAAVPVSGGGDPSKAAEFADKIAMWAFHCTEDEVINVRGSREMVQAMSDAGASPKLTEYTETELERNDYDHFSNHMFILPILLEPELLPWLFGKTKGSTSIGTRALTTVSPAHSINAKNLAILNIAAGRMHFAIADIRESHRIFDAQGHMLKE